MLSISDNNLGTGLIAIVDGNSYEQSDLDFLVDRLVENLSDRLIDNVTPFIKAILQTIPITRQCQLLECVPEVDNDQVIYDSELKRIAKRAILELELVLENRE